LIESAEAITLIRAEGKRLEIKGINRGIEKFINISYYFCIYCDFSTLLILLVNV
jgi:hypothetical protein